MKRWICALLAVAILLPVFATTAFAAGCGRGHGKGAGFPCIPERYAAPKTCRNNAAGTITESCVKNCQYVDENGDNVCDNCKNQCVDCGETRDDNADGICDNCGKCSHYADENQDGICDHQAECENRKNEVCKQTYRQNGHRGGKHRNHH